MCLLLTQTKQSPVLSNEWLTDFYNSNSDGVGVIHANNGDLVIRKILPTCAADFISFYHSEIAGRDCAFHLRMRTHGEIDLANCHPYEVLNRAQHGIDLWLMHNGILSSGNASDPSKSDTWHYINDYIKPMLAANPDFAFHPSFSEIVGDHIGSTNKFVLMDNEGRMTVINEGAGVYWAGLWLSNTYAWSASDSASRKPQHSAKKAKKQAKEKPIERVSYLSAKYGYGYQYGANSYYDDENENALELDIQQYLDDLMYGGFYNAATLPLDICLDFINEFSFDDFADLVIMTLDRNINEEWFIRAISDFTQARAAFPYLGRKTQTELFYE